jgi:iron(III)-salmochelin esterase
VVGRRSFLAWSSLVACSRREKASPETPPPAPATLPLPPRAPVDAAASGDAGEDASRRAAAPLGRRGQVAMDTWTLGGDGRAAVIVPAWTSPDEPLPLLVALHGRGEALKGPEKGVMGWPRDYALLRAIERVCAPPLTAADYEGFVDRDRLAEENRRLAEEPFKGFVVVCPYSPDVDLRKPEEIRKYAAYVVNVVLPRARTELPVAKAAAATGIDGVSLGGALALRIGLGHPELFGAVGTLQAAIGADQVPELLALTRAARAKNPDQKLRLLTSEKDYFRRAIARLSSELRAGAIDHDYADVPGPHDYVFNRGPGAIEMLLWHDRTLAHA